MKANKNLAQDKELSANLAKRLQLLSQRKKKLEHELSECFSIETFRQISILQNSIECCENRISGKFKDKCESLQVEIPGNIIR